MLKVGLLFLGLIVASQAAAVLVYPGWWPAATAYQAKDALGNYVFGHQDAHPGGPSFHKESGDVTGKKVGSYGVKDPDGKVRIVDYVADSKGFRANIKTSGEVDEEKAPADVTLSKAEEKPVVPVVYSPFGYYYASL